MNLTFSESAIKSAIQKGEPIEYSFSFIANDISDFLIRVFNQILKTINKEEMLDQLDYILMEFITNANKANLKRVYFKKNNLNIYNPIEYQEGMKNFIKIIQEDLLSYSSQIEKSYLYTKVYFRIQQNRLLISVINSQCPTKEEIKRVENIIEKSKSIRNTIEAFVVVGDKMEGASLGTISSLLMLRRLGLDESSYDFYSDEEKSETVVRIEIPLDTITDKQTELISDEIVKEIDSLPIFPENISKLQKMITHENIDFGRIAEVIQSDPALTADLLKIVNSAQYMIPQKVSNITNALSLIGMKGLKNLLYSFGTQDIFEKNYGRYDKLWEHAFCCASYSYNLAKEFKLNNLRDDAYIGGILHDMGKIIIYEVHPDLLEIIKSHCGSIGVEDNIMEKLALGSSHSKIGADISRKWNFPDNLTSIIKYHHRPLLAPDKDKDIVAVVYLANILTRIKDSRFIYSSIDPLILSRFHIQSEKEVLDLEKKLDYLYQQQKSKVLAED